MFTHLASQIRSCDVVVVGENVVGVAVVGAVGVIVSR